MYTPSEEQFKLDKFRYNNDKIYCTQNICFVVQLDVEECRYHLDWWQDDAKQMVLGLRAKGVAIKNIANELKKIIGQSPNDETIRRWIKVFRQVYHAKRTTV